jgi:hypothetical protein
MLPALGAASLALDAVQSLTSPAASSSSRAAGAFAPALSANAPSSSAAAVSGFGSTQISSDNINTLLDAQSLTPRGLGGAFGAGDPTSDSSRTASVSASSTASSAYNAINQLTQSTALPLGLSSFSVSA